MVQKKRLNFLYAKYNLFTFFLGFAFCIFDFIEIYVNKYTEF